MRTYKVFLSLWILLTACITAYVSFMYVYTDQMFAPTSLLAEPNPITPHQAWELPLVPFIHKVNTPERARKKDDKYAVSFNGTSETICVFDESFSWVEFCSFYDKKGGEISSSWKIVYKDE